MPQKVRLYNLSIVLKMISCTCTNLQTCKKTTHFLINIFFVLRCSYITTSHEASSIYESVFNLKMITIFTYFHHIFCQLLLCYKTAIDVQFFCNFLGFFIFVSLSLCFSCHTGWVWLQRGKYKTNKKFNKLQILPRCDARLWM